MLVLPVLLALGTVGLLFWSRLRPGDDVRVPVRALSGVRLPMGADLSDQTAVLRITDLSSSTVRGNLVEIGGVRIPVVPTELVSVDRSQILSFSRPA